MSRFLTVSSQQPLICVWLPVFQARTSLFLFVEAASLSGFLTLSWSSQRFVKQFNSTQPQSYQCLYWQSLLPQVWQFPLCFLNFYQNRHGPLQTLRFEILTILNKLTFHRLLRWAEPYQDFLPHLCHSYCDSQQYNRQSSCWLERAAFRFSQSWPKRSQWNSLYNRQDHAQCAGWSGVCYGICFEESTWSSWFSAPWSPQGMAEIA